MLTEQRSIVEEFNKFFSSLVGGLEEDTTDDALNRLSVCEHVFKFKVEDVLRLLRGLDTMKAVGADGETSQYGGTWN